MAKTRDYRSYVARTWGRSWKARETVYVMADGKRFVDNDRSGGPYAGAGGAPRALEDGSTRLLEDATFRLLE